MKHEDILTALEEISDKHIKEAEKPPKKKMKIFFRNAVAAILAIVIGVGLMNMPMRIAAKTVASVSEPRVMDRPYISNYINDEDWAADYEIFEAEQKLRGETTTQALLTINSFLVDGNHEFLQTKNNENKIWSPINAYIGLAMTTELTEGETRQQILDVLGVNDSDTLRKQVSALWESVYRDDSNEVCVLANSLWLEKGLGYNQETMDALAYHYYASVYQTDLGGSRANKDISAWINNNTGKFLQDSTKSIHLDEDTIMALYSTLYFQSKWTDEFNENNNTDDVFHMPEGDTQVVYMNKELEMMYYYWGENFSAVSMHLKNGSRMWFILPDEGQTTNDVLENGTYMNMILSNDWENNKYMKVNLSVPKFDVASTINLGEGLKNMGITKAFEVDGAEFGDLTSDSPIWLTEVSQSVRVEIDEEGVKAAVYIEIPGSGSPAPPDEIIDFVLDRPFLFIISNENIPLFAGCVNDPSN